MLSLFWFKRFLAEFEDWGKTDNCKRICTMILIFVFNYYLEAWEVGCSYYLNSRLDSTQLTHAVLLLVHYTLLSIPGIIPYLCLHYCKSCLNTTIDTTRNSLSLIWDLSHLHAKQSFSVFRFFYKYIHLWYILLISIISIFQADFLVD